MQVLSAFSDADVKRAYVALMNEGREHPPSLSHFRGLLKYGGVDFDRAFDRFTNRMPEGRPELWVSQVHGYRLRMMAENLGRKAHRKHLKYALDLERAGELSLPSDHPQLPAPPSERDRKLAAMDACQEFAKGSVMDRISQRWRKK